MRNAKRLIATLAILALTACNDSPTENAPAATFDMAITGDLSKTLRGPARFGADTDDNGDPVFGVLLAHDTSSYVLVLGKTGSERPAVGTYSVASEGTPNVWHAALVVGQGDELYGMLAGTEGHITITESSATRLRGSVDFKAWGFLDNNVELAKEVTVKGTFVAVPGENTIALSLNR